jgi:hypothetical protein
MGGALGTVLDYYLFPLLGLLLLALGAWSSWELWRPWASPGRVPSLATRVSALILGGVWGWFLTNLPHPQDTLHVTLGWPMPVMTLSRDMGRWLDLGARASIPCLLLDMAIGLGMVNAVLLLLWKLRPRRRPRPRAGFFDAWRVERPGQVSAKAPGRRPQRPLAASRAGLPGRRRLDAFGLAKLTADPNRSRA